MTFGNSVLAGLVAITSGCSTVYPWAALIIGAVAGLLYNVGSQVPARPPALYTRLAKDQASSHSSTAYCLSRRPCCQRNKLT